MINSYTCNGDYMKVFTFKRSQIIICICFIVCICGIIVLSLEKDIQVNTTPATNKVVVLDAGHGVPDLRY